MTNNKTDEIIGIYRQREDGDWEFVAAFRESELLDEHDWAWKVYQSLMNAGEQAKQVEFGSLEDLVDVWDGEAVSR